MIGPGTDKGGEEEIEGVLDADSLTDEAFVFLDELREEDLTEELRMFRKKVRRIRGAATWDELRNGIED